MSKGSSPPPAPDYTAAAERTAAGNLQAAQYATEANRVNQYNPWGSLTYTKIPGERSFDQSAYDKAMQAYYNSAQRPVFDANALGGDNGYQPANTAPVYTLPAPNRDDFYTKEGPARWEQQMTLTPELQAALDSQFRMQTARSQAAEGLLGRVGDAYSQGFDTSGFVQVPTSLPTFDPSGLKPLITDAPQFDQSVRDQAQQSVFDRYQRLLQPEYQKQETTLRNNLALQGFDPTADAWKADLNQYNTNRNQAYNDLADRSVLTGNQEMYNTYQNQLSGMNAMNTARQQAYANALNEHNLGVQNIGYQNDLRARQWQEQMALRNMPLAELNALNTGQQVQMPAFSPFSLQGQTGGADYMNAANQQYNAQVAATNAENAADSGFMGGLLSLGGSVLGGMVGMPSIGGLLGGALGGSLGGGGSSGGGYFGGIGPGTGATSSLYSLR